jgi:hypothetical protein
MHICKHPIFHLEAFLTCEAFYSKNDMRSKPPSAASLREHFLLKQCRSSASGGTCQSAKDNTYLPMLSSFKTSQGRLECSLPSPLPARRGPCPKLVEENKCGHPEMSPK